MAARNGRRTAVPGASLVVAVVVTAVAAAAVYWGFFRGASTPTTRGELVAASYSGVPNGPLPADFDTGQRAFVSSSAADPGASFRVDGGCATFAPQTTGRSAAYLSTPDLGRPVHSLGATIVFRPGSTPGAAALVISDGYDAGAFPPISPPFPVHFVITPVNWNLSVQKDNGTALDVVGAGAIDPPLRADGSQPVTVTLTVSDGEVTVDISTGVRQVVRDPRIAEWAGNVATFESFANFGQTDSRACFQKVWADSRGPG